jgi:DNA-binding PadR family transcriptional regulator
VLELAILGLLKEQPLHGYELKKRVGETLGTLWGISYGSLYPALRRLERDGSIESVEPAPVTSPAHRIASTGSVKGDLALAHLRRSAKPSRRTRKVYRITEHGARRLEDLLLEGGGDDDEHTFALKLVFCRHLDSGSRRELLERRRNALSARLARARRTGTARADRYARSLFEHRAESTKRDLEWVEALLAAERREGLPADHSSDAGTERFPATIVEQGATAP